MPVRIMACQHERQADLTEIEQKYSGQQHRVAALRVQVKELEHQRQAEESSNQMAELKAA